MSFSLYWRAIPTDRPPAVALPQPLKYVLARRLWEHDGTIRGEAVLDKSFVAYLEGLKDGSNGDVSEGAAELIAAIREHGAVELWIGEHDD